MADYNIEVGGGLGDLGGKVWRIGLMGYNSQTEECGYFAEGAGYGVAAKHLRSLVG
jgi:aspartate aminotransferase-like enzyme